LGRKDQGPEQDRTLTDDWNKAGFPAQAGGPVFSFESDNARFSLRAFFAIIRPLMETLSLRQNDILRGVIETHIETTQPVGSRSIAEKYAISFSPATIRHEMGALEEMGYLTHPHTSSGRLPTDHGYRYYLDHTSFDDRSEEPLSRLGEELSPVATGERLEDFLEHVSLLLSSLSQEVGLTLMPVAEAATSGMAERRQCLLQGLPYMLEKPEFQDVRKVRNLVGVLEEKVALMRWVLSRADSEQVSVSIGREHTHEALEDCAIVTARYAAGKNRQGVIAILGPRRMAYRQIIPLVSRMASAVGNILGQREPEV
jgi:heat-inducible transcriptional repressor